MAILLPASIITISTDSTAKTSLYPVIQAKDTILTDRITYRFRSIQRHHIVMFVTSKALTKQGFTENPSYVRRIIALPEETLEIRHGRIFLNDKPFDDREIGIPKDFQRSRITLGTDEYYAIGNNPDYTDLETFGAIVPRQDIQGQILLRIYPFDRIGFMP